MKTSFSAATLPAAAPSRAASSHAAPAHRLLALLAYVSRRNKRVLEEAVRARLRGAERFASVPPVSVASSPEPAPDLRRIERAGSVRGPVIEGHIDRIGQAIQEGDRARLDSQLMESWAFVAEAQSALALAERDLKDPW
ncbi:MAG: hypothetical protein HY554_11520 [Elusimicrobia bacterium]|nr:hypothetical protein [Elusimicrobiota bacterium]